MKKKLLTILVLIAFTKVYAIDPNTFLQYPLSDEGAVTYDISTYAATNPALHDLHGLPYTRQVAFTLEHSTNLTGGWQPICTVTNWSNPYHMLTAIYTNGILVSCTYTSAPAPQAEPEPQMLGKCLFWLIMVGTGIVMAVQLVKICKHCLPPTYPPSEPPDTNSVAFTVPPQVLSGTAGFLRVGPPQ